MKEATGELNATVVTVLLVASLASFFYFTIWPLIKGNMNANTKCSQAICEKAPNPGDMTVNCYMPEDPNDRFTCANKG